jgi:hypothetical protein
MNSNVLSRRLEALRVQRARIDRAVEQLEAQIEAQEQAGKRGAPVLEVEPARGGRALSATEGVVRQASCHCAKPGGELHGPYWRYYCMTDGKARSKCAGKNRTAGT